MYSFTFEVVAQGAWVQGAFFFLLQSEDGDLFKVTIEHEEEEVKAVKIKYFDTVPVAASLCILKSGFLFVASEFGNQCVASLFFSSVPFLTGLPFQAICINSKNWVMTITSPNLAQRHTLLSAWLTLILLCHTPFSALDPSTTWLWLTR